jgi:hypothetical protein
MFSIYHLKDEKYLLSSGKKDKLGKKGEIVWHLTSSRFV